MKTKNLKRQGGFREVFAAVLSAALFWVAQPAHAVVLDTLTGGPSQISPPYFGFEDGNTFSIAQFNVPSGIALNGSGNTLFVADRANNAIRKITDLGNTANSQTITILGAADGINSPIAVALDGAANLYVLNRGNGNNGTIQQFDQFGDLIAVRAANLVNATALALDGSTNLYVTVNGNSVVRISPFATNTVGVIAAAGTSLRGITVLDNGLLALTDGGNHGILVLNPANGVATNFTGFNGVGDKFGTRANAKFNGPEMIAKAGGGFLVVADGGNHRVKVVDPLGTVTNLYGVASTHWYTGPGAFPGWWDGTVCTTDQVGCPEGRQPFGVLVAGNGDVYSTETYYHLIRKSTSTGLTGPSGGGGGTNVVTVVAPTITPNTGYFPMGRIITVNSPNPDVHYTTDGTTPTQNSPTVPMNGNTGFIRWASATNDLTFLRVRAFIGTNASVTTSGQSATTNSVGVPAGLSDSLLAGVGSKIVVPVVADLRTNDQVKSYIFRVEVTPNGGAPMISDQFDALSVTSNDFIRVVTAAKEGAIGNFNVQPYSIGTTRGLSITAIGTNANMSFQFYGIVAMVAIPIPTTAQVGQTYSVSVLNSSATSDGGQTAVAFPPKPPMTIIVTNVPYTVGDSAVGGWYNAGDFGNRELDNADVNNAFYAATGLRIPYTFSDVYDSMDAWPQDDFEFLGGDGELTFLDWQVTLQRALRLDPSNWQRAWSFGGDRTNASTTLVPGGVSDSAAESFVGSPWHRAALVGARPVGNVNPGALVSVPVYLRTDSSTRVKGFQFRCMITPDNGGPSLLASPSFVSAAGVGGPTQGSSQPNDLACGWSLDTVNFGPHGSNYLGTVRFTMPLNAALGHTYTISFANAGGALNLQTPYNFETKQASIAVGVPAAPVTDITSDEWKTYFFGSTTAPEAAPGLDGDQDGVPNWSEYIAGTSPTDINSRLHFDSTSSQVVNNQRQVNLSWLSAPGKTYEILGGSTPGSANGSVLGTVIGDGTVKQFTDTNPGSSRFYRLRVQP